MGAMRDYWIERHESILDSFYNGEITERECHQQLIDELGIFPDDAMQDIELVKEEREKNV